MSIWGFILIVLTSYISRSMHDTLSRMSCRWFFHWSMRFWTRNKKELINIYKNQILANKKLIWLPVKHFLIRTYRESNDHAGLRIANRVMIFLQ